MITSSLYIEFVDIISELFIIILIASFFAHVFDVCFVMHSVIMTSWREFLQPRPQQLWLSLHQ